MKCIRDIVYCETIGADGMGDLFLPDDLNADTPLALVIHGGGWSSMERKALEGVALWLVDNGFAAFNADYRLTGTASWPACGNDCLEAARFLLHGDIPALNGVRRDRLGVIGGSSGGHLALWTGLSLKETSWIVSISGICDPVPDLLLHAGRYSGLLGGDITLDGLNSLAPQNLLTPQAPPMLCTHMIEDDVVPLASRDSFVKTAASQGIHVDTYTYPMRQGLTGHGIWIEGSSPHRLIPELENRIMTFFNAVGVR